MMIWLRASALFFCLAAPAPPSFAQGAGVKDGIAAWQRADHRAAVAIWKPLADKGDADAAFNLGQAYRLGRGVPLDLAASQLYLLRAARQNHHDAQVTLGLLLFQNGRQADGLKWLIPAAKRGDARSQLIYGTALFNGDGVERDVALALAMIERAANQGLGPAAETLADMRSIVAQQKRRGAGASGKATTAPTAAPSPVRAATSGPGKWRVQLGAFSTQSAAEALFARLASRPSLAGRRPMFVKAGSMTRLQAGPFADRASATRACAALSKGGQPCFPVAP